MRKKSGSIGPKILLALVVLAVWYLYAHGWRGHAYNLKVFSGRLGMAVDQALVQGGVTDRQVSGLVHQEHGRLGLTWIRTDRQIALDDPASVGSLTSALRGVAKKFHCQFVSRAGANPSVTIKLGPFVFENLVFGAPAARGATPSLLTGPQVAFVIDDVAYSAVPMDHFAALGVPLTFAILPRDKKSKLLAEKARGMNFPVILHLPMEPLDRVHNDPGGAALYLQMTSAQLREQFNKDVASVPYIVGINNHMGSAFTESEPKMELVLKWVREKNLFFLDSHTSAHSIVRRAAKRVGVPCLVNETFLDNSDDVLSIEHQLDLVLQLALERKRTIAIGHYRRKHLVEALAKKIPEFKARGVAVVTLPSFYPL